MVPTKEVPVLEKSLGTPQADGVFNSLYEWQLKYKVVALSLDTTRSNTEKAY